LKNTLQHDNSSKSKSDEFNNFIIESQHPCLMALSMAKKKLLSVGEYGNITEEKSIIELADDLLIFINEVSKNSSQLMSYVAIFDTPRFCDERKFEEYLWRALKSLNSKDNTPWSCSVSCNPLSKKFSFSYGGEAFFIVGMHPNASRLARKAPHLTLVFNLHEQFESLRKNGTFEKIRNSIRKRDRKLQGSVNPMLANYGKSTEAVQYSGRQVGSNWKCPVAFPA